jgi:hypothetical protein
MRSLLTKRKALGGWRATQGEIPVTGMKLSYFVGCGLQGLSSRIGFVIEPRFTPRAGQLRIPVSLKGDCL